MGINHSIGLQPSGQSPSEGFQCVISFLSGFLILRKDEANGLIWLRSLATSCVD